MEAPKGQRAEFEAVREKSTWLNVQLLWGCDAWNATPEEAAQQVGVTGMGGEEHVLEAAARRN